MPRTILHLDLDAFFCSVCSVEERRNLALVGRPFAVGGRPERHGVVSSCSYVTWQYGVRSAMPMARALRLCRELIIVPLDFRAYQQTSEQVMVHLQLHWPSTRRPSNTGGLGNREAMSSLWGWEHTHLSWTLRTSLSAAELMQ